MSLGYASEFKGYQLWCPDSKKVIQSRDITLNETIMFFPGQESAIPTGELLENCEKVELEVPSNVAQGGYAVPHSSSEDHIEETNPNNLDIPSSKELQTSCHYSIAHDMPRRATRKPVCYSVGDEHGLIAYVLAVAQEIPEGIEPST